jgi:L-gulonate 3-dehydrogenase
MRKTVAIIGAGLVGRAWSISFARGGCDVRLFDPVPGVAAKARAIAGETIVEMQSHDLLNGQAAAEVVNRISVAETMAEAVENAVHVQESSPENAESKLALFTELDKLVPKDAVIASSTSAILPSVFTAHVATRDRCLVAHPLNPPHLIPAVEVVPAPWTSHEALQRTKSLMLEIGQHPIMMTKEIDGFLMNRLQGAVLEECFRLVSAGIVSVDDIDASLRDGLALRWSFMGPFETIDLNAPGGVADYVKRYQKGFARQFETQTTRVDWSGDVLATIEQSRRKHLKAENVAARQHWRDSRLMALAAHKRRAASEVGE